jgi:capsid protein
MEPRGRNLAGVLDEQNNEVIEDAWEEWGRKGVCTIDGQLSWRDAQHLIVECVARDGEFLLAANRRQSGRKPIQLSRCN